MNVTIFHIKIGKTVFSQFQKYPLYEHLQNIGGEQK